MSPPAPVEQDGNTSSSTKPNTFDRLRIKAEPNAHEKQPAGEQHSSVSLKRVRLSPKRERVSPPPPESPECPTSVKRREVEDSLVVPKKAIPSLMSFSVPPLMPLPVLPPVPLPSTHNVEFLIEDLVGKVVALLEKEPGASLSYEEVENRFFQMHGFSFNKEFFTHMPPGSSLFYVTDVSRGRIAVEFQCGGSMLFRLVPIYTASCSQSEFIERAVKVLHGLGGRALLSAMQDKYREMFQAPFSDDYSSFFSNDYSAIGKASSDKVRAVFSMVAVTFVLGNIGETSEKQKYEESKSISNSRSLSKEMKEVRHDRRRSRSRRRSYSRETRRSRSPKYRRGASRVRSTRDSGVSRKHNSEVSTLISRIAECLKKDDDDVEFYEVEKSFEKLFKKSLKRECRSILGAEDTFGRLSRRADDTIRMKKGNKGDWLFRLRSKATTNKRSVRDRRSRSRKRSRSRSTSKRDSREREKKSCRSRSVEGKKYSRGSHSPKRRSHESPRKTSSKERKSSRSQSKERDRLVDRVAICLWRPGSTTFQELIREYYNRHRIGFVADMQAIFGDEAPFERFAENCNNKIIMTNDQRERYIFRKRLGVDMERRRRRSGSRRRRSSSRRRRSCSRAKSTFRESREDVIRPFIDRIVKCLRGKSRTKLDELKDLYYDRWNHSFSAECERIFGSKEPFSRWTNYTKDKVLISEERIGKWTFELCRSEQETSKKSHRSPSTARQTKSKASCRSPSVDRHSTLKRSPRSPSIICLPDPKKENSSGAVSTKLKGPVKLDEKVKKEAAHTKPSVEIPPGPSSQSDRHTLKKPEKLMPTAKTTQKSASCSVVNACQSQHLKKEVFISRIEKCLRRSGGTVGLTKLFKDYETRFNSNFGADFTSVFGSDQSFEHLSHVCGSKFGVFRDKTEVWKFVFLSKQPNNKSDELQLLINRMADCLRELGGEADFVTFANKYDNNFKPSFRTKCTSLMGKVRVYHILAQQAQDQVDMKLNDRAVWIFKLKNPPEKDSL